jgi:hypothetical protein
VTNFESLLPAGREVKASLYLAVVLLAAVALRGAIADDGLDAKYPLLAALKLPAESLPAGCTLQAIPAEVPELKGLKNGEITTNPRFFLIGDERFAELLDAKQIEAVYFGMYKEKNEWGITGWACRSEAAAKALHDKLAVTYKNVPETDRFRLWQVDKCVAWLWRDPGVSDRCFKRLEAVIQARFAGDKAAAAALVESDKRDARAKEMAPEFLKALKTEDVEAVMKTVTTPFFWDGKENVVDLPELRRKWVAVFEDKPLTEIEYRVEQAITLDDPEAHLGPKDRELLTEIFNNSDRIVIVSLTIGPRKSGMAVMVRFQGDQAWVAGFRD